MKTSMFALAFVTIAAPALAQHENHGAPPQAAAVAQQPQQAPRPQPVTPPAKMNDDIPPGTDEFIKLALEKSPRHSEWVDIKLQNGAAIKSWVVYPESKSKTGVVIVIHENRGMNDWTRAVADQLAEDGFIAIAPDMLSGMGPGGGNSDSIAPDQRTAAIGRLTNEQANERIDRVREYAIQIPAANGRVGIIGFCWGGARVFNYAIHQPAINAGVVYYGQAPQDPALLDRIAAPLLGLFGEADTRVNTTIETALPMLNKDRKKLDAHMFRGAGHAFLRQQFAHEFNKRAAEGAWPLTIRFFKEHLK